MNLRKYNLDTGDIGKLIIEVPDPCLQVYGGRTFKRRPG